MGRETCMGHSGGKGKDAISLGKQAKNKLQVVINSSLKRCSTPVKIN
jgi:hypothetical protein